MKLIILSDTHIKPGQSLLEMLPDVVKELLEIGSEVCTEYANALFEHGVDAITYVRGCDRYP